MNVDEKIAGNHLMARLLRCTAQYFPRHIPAKSLKFFETSIVSLDPETVALPAFSILSAMAHQRR